MYKLGFKAKIFRDRLLHAGKSLIHVEDRTVLNLNEFFRFKYMYQKLISSRRKQTNLS